MRDLVKRSSCLGSTGKKIGPVKLSKWELPIPRSKSYWDGVCAEIEKKHKRPPLTNSRQLRRILPPQSYQLVAPILGMPKYAESLQDEDASLSSESTNSALTFDLEVHPPTPRGGEKSGGTREVNPYSLFLRKPRRKVVVWRPLREEDLKGYDPEATLEMRATRLMDRICKEFCDWVRQLGEQVIDEDTLKDMFEINFTSDACKSMQVVLKEMPTVPLPVVKVRYCPEANELEATKKQMREDLKVEARPKRTFAFGRSLPRNLRFVPPRTSIKPKWLDCEYIPKDLENMDVVWDDIGNLDSVQEFYSFLKSKKVLRSSKLLTNLEQGVKG